jgi:hypothetical protein
VTPEAQLGWLSAALVALGAALIAYAITASRTPTPSSGRTRP